MIGPQLLRATVMHHRKIPFQNRFSYATYCIILPLGAIEQPEVKKHLAINRRALTSFFECDHGPPGKGGLQERILALLKEQDAAIEADTVLLIAMPRILNYVFNPISFYVFLDEALQPRAILCEVNNTFGERHYYFCANDDQAPILDDLWISGQKHFHVSPFLKREGSYRFRFSFAPDRFIATIIYSGQAGQQQLVTSISGRAEPLSRRLLRRAFFATPLLTLRVIALIHWQALKLFVKGASYVTKPMQLKVRFSRCQNSAPLSRSMSASTAPPNLP